MGCRERRAKPDRPDRRAMRVLKAPKAHPVSKAPLVLSDQAVLLVRKEIRVRLDRAARQVCLAALDPPAHKDRKGLPEWLERPEPLAPQVRPVRWAPPV